MFARKSWLLLALLLSFLGLPRFARGQDRPQTLHYPSGGKSIRVDRFAPTGPRRPAVLVLHGAGGVLLDGPEMRRVARALAAAGHPAYVLHYFNRTGTLVARDAVLRRLYVDWLPVVRDGVAYVHAQEGAEPVGIYGYSLGAFLAMGASGDNPQVGAIVEQAGGIWDNREERLGRHVPPVLMVHGREDRRVPFAQYAVPLERFLGRRNTVVRTRFVPGEGHSFSATAQAGVRTAAVEFFARQLPVQPASPRR